MCKTDRAAAEDVGAEQELRDRALALERELHAVRDELQRALDDRVRAEEERTCLLRESAAANRAKDEFLAMLGHELRNPLAPIVTAFQLIKARGDRHACHELSVIERQVGHLVRLVDDLLDVSRITRGQVKLHKSPLELGRVVCRAVEMASPLFEQRRHRLVVAVPPVGILLLCDEERLAQVLANLLTNAARYTPAGGEVRVTATCSADEVVISVADNGIGIDPEVLPRIFNLFVQGTRTLDRAEGGLGLGLALVMNLVAMHGGTVEARSEGRDRGSEFVVRLPAHRPESVDSLPRPAREPCAATPRGSRRILIVDDNVDATELLAEAARMMGHEVAVAHEGLTALELARSFCPEVAVLDIGLPVMDGYQLARRLRASPAGAALRLIAVTGYGQPGDLQQARAAGFDEHFVKPVDLGPLFAAVERQGDEPGTLHVVD